MSKTKTMDNTVSEQESTVDIESMPLTTYDEYRAYNAAARKANKKLRECRYPCKPCPIELHPHERIIFGRVDQPQNPLPVYLSNHLIHFEKTLVPGQTYDLPRIIINYLGEKGTPIFERVEQPDGSVETRLVGKDHRFSFRGVYKD